MEQACVKQDVEEISFCFYIASVNIDNIGQKLECIKRNTYRQGNLSYYGRMACYGLKVFLEKCTVFEYAEQTEVDNTGCNNGKL